MSLYPNLRMGSYPSIHPIVGGEVFVRRNSPGSEMHKGKVTKVGLKYFYVTTVGHTLQFKRGCSPGGLDEENHSYTIWNSEAEYRDSVMVGKLKSLAYRISQELVRKDLTGEMVDQAHALLIGDQR